MTTLLLTTRERYDLAQSAYDNCRRLFEHANAMYVQVREKEQEISSRLDVLTNDSPEWENTRQESRDNEALISSTFIFMENANRAMAASKKCANDAELMIDSTEEES